MQDEQGGSIVEVEEEASCGDSDGGGDKPPPLISLGSGDEFESEREDRDDTETQEEGDPDQVHEPPPPQPEPEPRSPEGASAKTHRDRLFESPDAGNSGPRREHIVEMCISLMQFLHKTHPFIMKWPGLEPKRVSSKTKDIRFSKSLRAAQLHDALRVGLRAIWFEGLVMAEHALALRCLVGAAHQKRPKGQTLFLQNFS